MSLQAPVRRQYQAIVDNAARCFAGNAVPLPAEGWVATVRKALGMSGAQLARRLGVSRARVSQAEQAEGDGGVTLKSMQAMADAMGCRFVYAIVPEGRVEDVIAAQARRKANALVGRASSHMALESQDLPAARVAEEEERIARDLLHAMPRDLWSDR